MSCSCAQAPLYRQKKIEGRTFPYFLCPCCLKVEYRQQDLAQIRRLERERDERQQMLNCG